MTFFQKVLFHIIFQQKPTIFQAICCKSNIKIVTFFQKSYFSILTFRKERDKLLQHFPIFIKRNPCFLKNMGSFFIYFILLIYWAICCACPVILTFFIHSKGIPCCWTEDFFFRYVVHTNRNSQHRAHGDQICSDMSIGNCSMVSSPVVHHIVSGLECAFSCTSRCKPGTWPCIIRTFPQFIRDFFRQVYGLSFCDLQQQVPDPLQDSGESW